LSAHQARCLRRVPIASRGSRARRGCRGERHEAGHARHGPRRAGTTRRTRVGHRRARNVTLEKTKEQNWKNTSIVETGPEASSVGEFTEI
jgi:hypothetical protein